MKTLSFLGALAAAFVLAWLTVQPTGAVPADAPETAFSAERAMADVRAMARGPHPTGSRENAHVRDHLVRRLEALGLQVSTQRADATFQREPGFVAGGSIENLIGVLPANAPGADPAAPAIMLMSHYDSAVGSPGAADDAAGVSASLETVRVLLAEDQPRRRNLIVLITDGEEQGLLGAGAFFADHPLAERVGATVNLETRGAGGRAMMFETGRDNGAMIGLYARAVSQPSTTSLASFLYSILPNDTDFSHPRDLGGAGFNIAFIGDPYEYHSPTSTPATLDRGSLQHLGSQALDLTRALVVAEALPERRPNAVFSDLFGLFTLAYPAWLGWLPVLLSGLILAGLVWRTPDRRAGLRGLGFGVLGAVAVTAAAMLLAQGLLALTGYPTDFVENRPLLARLDTFEMALFFAALAAALLVGRLALRGRTPADAATAERRHEGPALGLLAFGWLLSLVLQIFAAEAALVAAWPTLIGAVALLSARRLGRWAWPVAAGLGIIGSAWMLGITHGVFLGVGATTPIGPAAFAVLALLPMAALLTRGLTSRLAVYAGGAALVVAVVLGLWLRLAAPSTSEHPLPTHVLYVVNPSAGTAQIVAPLQRLDYWTRAVLRGPDAAEIGEAAIPALSSRPMRTAEAQPVAAAAPDVSIEPLADGRVRVRISTGVDVRELRLTLEADEAITDLSVAGRPADAAPAGEPTVIRWADPSRGVEMTLRPPAGARLRWAAYRDGWPTDAEPLPIRSPDRMAWGSSDSLVVIGETELAPAS